MFKLRRRAIWTSKRHALVKRYGSFEDDTSEYDDSYEGISMPEWMLGPGQDAAGPQ